MVGLGELGSCYSDIPPRMGRIRIRDPLVTKRRSDRDNINDSDTGLLRGFVVFCIAVVIAVILIWVVPT